MKAGNMVRFDYDEKNVTYGTIIWVKDGFAEVNYKNPYSKTFEVNKISVERLTLIGDYPPVIKRKYDQR